MSIRVPVDELKCEQVPTVLIHKAQKSINNKINLINRDIYACKHTCSYS